MNLSRIKVKYKLIVWMAVIFALSSIPNAKIVNESVLDLIIRKTLHITEYFILFNFAYFTFGKNNLKATIFAITYAASDEFHQKFVPGRGPTFHDVLVDTVGVILGNVFIWKLYKRVQQKSRSC